jgi:hypothetical protein
VPTTALPPLQKAVVDALAVAACDVVHSIAPELTAAQEAALVTSCGALALSLKEGRLRIDVADANRCRSTAPARGRDPSRPPP